jgi:hypothetical protein
LILYHPKTTIAATTIAPTTEPATIPPMGIDFDTDKVGEGEVVGEGEGEGEDVGVRGVVELLDE